MSQLNALRFVELYDLAVQRNIQSGRRDRDLNEIRVWSLVGYYFAGTDDPVLRSRFHPRTALNLVLTVCRGRGHTQHPLIDLVIEPDLTAADKASAAAAIAIGPAHAAMGTGIESGPVIDKGGRRRWGRIGRTARHIGAFGYSGH